MSSAEKGYQKALEKIKQAEHEEHSSLELVAVGLTALPPEIAQLANLTTLNLRDNKLTVLPPEIAQLTDLTTLYLGDNQKVEERNRRGRADLQILQIQRRSGLAAKTSVGVDYSGDDGVA